MRHLLFLLTAISLGLTGAQGAEKQNAKSCCDGGACCVKQQGCCQKAHR